MTQWLSWNDLTEMEKAQATESYIWIREQEEQRQRDEITEEYPEPINPDGVTCCRFERMEDGYIYVDI